MKLIRKDQAIHVDKTNGTEVDYYLLDDAEIHYNKSILILHKSGIDIVIFQKTFLF